MATPAIIDFPIDWIEGVLGRSDEEDVSASLDGSGNESVGDAVVGDTLTAAMA